MAIVYYPKESIVMRRDTVSSSYEQLYLSLTPNTILYFGTSSTLDTITAAAFEMTASWAVSASYAYGSISSASWADIAGSASYAATASYAMNGGGSGVSASYATTASYALNGGGSG
jgi:hypothetical protein